MKITEDMLDGFHFLNAFGEECHTIVEKNGLVSWFNGGKVATTADTYWTKDVAVKHINESFDRGQYKPSKVYFIKEFIKGLN